jgi:uncharacterized membrane protein YtjA (UPF0391 family)
VDTPLQHHAHKPMADIPSMKWSFSIAYWRVIMLYYALVFFVVAVVAGFLGFTGIAGATFGIAKILFFVFLAACIITFIFGRRNIL